VFDTGNWRWTQYVQLIVAACVWVYGFPAIFFETYSRAVQRKIARKTGVAHKLPPAQSGITISEMIMVTAIEPLQSIVSDPLTIGMALYLSINFAVLFQ
jgi:MFS transporter, DHA1 family, multidrug resistance protein